jgi:hypothetical protein
MEKIVLFLSKEYLEKHITSLSMFRTHYTPDFFKGIVSRGKALEWMIRPKLRFGNPFFRLKIGRFKAMARRVAYPTM